MTPAKMGLSTEELGYELEVTAQEVLGRLKSRHLFQSQWDTAAFVVFLIFVGECGCWSSRPTSQPRGSV